jgi:hypothetical protein
MQRLCEGDCNSYVISRNNREEADDYGEDKPSSFSSFRSRVWASASDGLCRANIRGICEGVDRRLL